MCRELFRLSLTLIRVIVPDGRLRRVIADVDDWTAVSVQVCVEAEHDTVLEDIAAPAPRPRRAHQQIAVLATPIVPNRTCSQHSSTNGFGPILIETVKPCQ